MIGFLQGTVKVVGSKTVIDVGGVGYLVATPQQHCAGEKVELFITAITRDNGTRLFGFSDEVEQQMFDALCQVSGVGPGAALSILSLGVAEVARCVRENDIAGLRRAQGVGTKGAQSIVSLAKFDGLQIETASGDCLSDPQSEAVDTLCSLGFSTERARNAVVVAVADGAVGDDIVRCALVSLR